MNFKIPNYQSIQQAQRYGKSKKVIVEANEVQLEQVWKKFGRDNEAGKLIWSLYKTGKPAKIDYPKLKSKPQSALPMKEISNKACPQKTIVEYPQQKQAETQQIHKIDLIKKRKKQTEIQKEIDTYYCKPDPVKRGENRQMKIEQLQQKNKYSKGCLPDKVLPLALNQREINTLKANAVQKLDDKAFEREMRSKQKKIGDNLQAKKGTDIAELDGLFEAIVKEIEERQDYLDQIANLDEPEMKKQIKNQIIERVAELQKIADLKQGHM